MLGKLSSALLGFILAKNNEVNQALIELNLPFTLDLKNSHYDTLYYNRRFSDNYLRLYFEKIKEGNLTDEEVWQLLSILPEKQRDYWISITYEEGKNTFFFHNCLYARSFEENVGNDESEMVNQVNQVITESNLPFAVNLKTSHYDTLRHNDMLRVQVEKTNEKGLTIEEIEQLVKMLPEQQNAYRMEIVYGKSTYEKRIGSVFRSKEKSITIFLDENKKVTECSGQDQELCEAIELLVGCSS